MLEKRCEERFDHFDKRFDQLERRVSAVEGRLKSVEWQVYLLGKKFQMFNQDILQLQFRRI